MLRSIKSYVSEPRKGIVKLGIVVGSVYIVKGYFQNHLEEVKYKLELERTARETLKRRFEQTQEDVSFTVLALLQPLAEHILTNMDVEGLTQELQNRSKARHAARQVRERSPPSLSSSIEVIQEQDVRSDVGSAVVSIASSNDIGIVDLSASIATENSSSGTDSAPSDTGNYSVPSEVSLARTNTELWNDVKMLTLTRTLTTLYSTTLLSLLTTIQLTLLSRSKYLQAVIQSDREERMRQIVEAQFSVSNMLFSPHSFEKILSGDISAVLEQDNEPSEGFNLTSISEEVEGRFLTMSWWILHVGWKDVEERVRKGVEDVFDGVSLKTKLAAVDLHRLISDVRRRVEQEVTFERTERQTNFLSSLLPPTPETVQHVLTQGGFVPPSLEPPQFEAEDLTLSQFSFTSAPGASQSLQGPIQPEMLDLPSTQGPPYIQPPVFTALLEETRSIIESSDFMHVLQLCLDRATEIMFTGLERNVFVDSSEQTNGATSSGEPVKIRLAGLLPGLARWSMLAMRGMPNELVDNLLEMREVKCLSAVIFARFQEMVE